MIAMALACSPSLIIADEPTTALDVMVQAQVLSCSKELQHELGLAMLFITHDLSVLVELCDRLAIMYAGRIVEEGPADDVFGDPSHPYTWALPASFPRSATRASGGPPAAWRGTRPTRQHLPSGCTFHPRCPRAFEPCPSVDPSSTGGPPRQAACLLLRRAGVPDRDLRRPPRSPP